MRELLQLGAGSADLRKRTCGCQLRASLQNTAQGVWTETFHARGAVNSRLEENVKYLMLSLSLGSCFDFFFFFDLLEKSPELFVFIAIE